MAVECKQMEGRWHESSSGRVQGGGTRAWQQVRSKADPSWVEDWGLGRWGVRRGKGQGGLPGLPRSNWVDGGTFY